MAYARENWERVKMGSKMSLMFENTDIGKLRMTKNTKLPSVTVANARPGDKLDLPHGVAQSEDTDILDVQSAHVILGPSNIWWILIVLKNGGSYTVDYTKENADYLTAIGVHVEYPMGPPDPKLPVLGI